MTPAGFEPTISTGERSQTHALDHAATGTGPPIRSRKEKYPQFFVWQSATRDMHRGDRRNTQRLITCVSRNRLSCLPDLSQTRTVRADSDTSPLAVGSPVVSGWPQNFNESVHMAIFFSRCRNVTPARHYTTCSAGTLHSVPARIAKLNSTERRNQLVISSATYPRNPEFKPRRRYPH